MNRPNRRRTFNHRPGTTSLLEQILIEGCTSNRNAERRGAVPRVRTRVYRGAAAVGTIERPGAHFDRRDPVFDDARRQRLAERTKRLVRDEPAADFLARSAGALE
jgi:hypothetical protein